MQLSKAIYRLTKLAKVLDIEECAEDVEALNEAVKVMTKKLREDQMSMAAKHVLRPIPGMGEIRVY